MPLSLFVASPATKSGKGMYYVIPFEILRVHLSALQSFSLLQDIFMQLHTNVKHYETTCRTNELWFTYFWSYSPLEHNRFYHVS